MRPWLGPDTADRYEWQLSAVEGVGLDDIEMDQTVSLLVGFATNIARAEHEVRLAERESGDVGPGVVGGERGDAGRADGEP